jgi:signal transduction histidine kinase
VQGVLPAPLYDNTAYLFIFFIFFGITLYLSVYLANSIAKQLYRREKDLTIAYEELENAEKAKSRYVMSVVHDLKTPIAAATTYLNMILEGNLGQVPAEQLRPLERSRLRLNHAITTINDILHISQLKLETGIDKADDVDLNVTFDEIYSEMRVLFRSKNIQYSFWTNSEEKSIIKAEPKLVKLALSNLVSNAYKYTEDGGKVEVRLESGKNGINIRIADNGIGIPDSEKEKIFNDFYRSSVSKSKGIEGTGLGMSIVMQIIQRYGGSVHVESPSYLGSSDRPGTEFVIFLPER